MGLCFLFIKRLIDFPIGCFPQYVMVYSVVGTTILYHIMVWAQHGLESSLWGFRIKLTLEQHYHGLESSLSGFRIKLTLEQQYGLESSLSGFRIKLLLDQQYHGLGSAYKYINIYIYINKERYIYINIYIV